jgi:mRNA interferase MazF
MAIAMGAVARPDEAVGFVPPKPTILLGQHGYEADALGPPPAGTALRGEVWTIAGQGDYDGKPRPCVILQSDLFWATDSVTVLLVSKDYVPDSMIRLTVMPSPENGLYQQSQFMADKITTAKRARLGKRIGRLSDEDMGRLTRAALVFLGLAESPKP